MSTMRNAIVFIASITICCIITFIIFCSNQPLPDERLVHLSSLDIDNSYLTDTTYSISYNKSGDRKYRYTSYIKDIPIFKTKWTTWKGGKLIDYDKLCTLVNIVIPRFSFIQPSTELTQLLVETIITESHGGYYIRNKHGDHGICQIKVNTANDLSMWLKANYCDIYVTLEAFRNPKLSTSDNLEQNIPYAIAVALCEYWRKAGPNFTQHISTITERAIMWKSVYNTKKGKGTVIAYLDKARTYPLTFINTSEDKKEY